MIDLARDNARLRAENAELRERLRQIEAALLEEAALPREWGLTQSQGTIARVLLARDHASYDLLAAALYTLRGREAPDPAIVKSFVCQIRRKLRPFGAEIETVWGVGYRLADRQRWRQAA